MKHSKEIRRQAFENNIFFSLINKMPKTKKPVAKKIFKVKRKTDERGDKNNFVIRFKGDWAKQDVKELRSDLDYYLSRYLEDKKEEADEKRDILTEM